MLNNKILCKRILRARGCYTVTRPSACEMPHCLPWPQRPVSLHPRTLPLFLKPPSDRLISQTPHWKALLYKVCSNISGLADAPRVWALEVISRLLRLCYTQHSFDHVIFLKRCPKGQIISVILVYVDDFLGTHRVDYDFEEVQRAFTWGSFEFREVDKPIVFKCKEVELFVRPGSSGRLQLQLTQKAFLDGFQQGKLGGVPLGCRLTAVASQPDET